MRFASDNWSGAAPQIVAAIAAEAGNYATAYGASALDRAVEDRFRDIFERDLAVYFVATGSAANAMALTAVNRPGGIVFCHSDSHILEDECGAVEYATGGARLFPVAGAEGKIDPGALESAIGRFDPDFVHSGQPMAVSITQQNEAGGIYRVEEIRRIADISHAGGLPLHMDGARFANALVALGCSPADMTWKAGVDLLSFGGTKNGCVGAEALLVFDESLTAQVPFLRKRAGLLFSKARFVAAQFAAYFEDGLWLDLARHANAMADRLREGLAESRHGQIAWPAEGNEIFVVMKAADAARMKAAGALFYERHAPAGVTIAPDETMVRLVTSFSTSEEDVGGFLAALDGR